MKWLKNISKKFDDSIAIQDISFKLEEGKGMRYMLLRKLVEKEIARVQTKINLKIFKYHRGNKIY